MWLIGGLIGFLLGVAGGYPFWLLGILVGALIGKLIERQHAGESRVNLELAARVGALEHLVASLRDEVGQMRRGASVPMHTVAQGTPNSLASAPHEPVATVTPKPVPAASRIAAMAGIPPGRPADGIDLQLPPSGRPEWLSRFWAGNPLVKIGIVLLFFGLASGLRLAAEYGLLPIPARLFLTTVAGIGLIVFGFAKTRDGEHRTFGLSLQGGGFALLYLVTYFMLSRYVMIGQGVAFSLFAVFGIVCMAMAARQDGPALAVLGLSGAFLAPLLAGGRADTPLPLFSYFALLNAFILGVDWFKSWRVLNVAGFIFTLAIGMAWAIGGYQEKHYLVTQFFLMIFLVAYSAMPVLTAVFRAPGLNGWRDGMLLFGTPLAGSVLQSRLMENVAYGNAWSALIAAVWYLALWVVLLRRKDPDNEVVERSHLGLAVAFFTLSIPLAFGAQLTSVLWAIEGGAVLWYGVRMRRILPQLTGLLMQIAAGAALFSGWNELSHRVPVANDVVLGGVLLTMAGLASARMLRSLEQEAFVPPSAPFVWAMLWWFGIGLNEVHRFTPESLHAPFDLLLAMATIAALEGLAAWWSWPQVHAASILLLVAMWIAPALSIDFAGHPLPGLMSLMLPAALGLHYRLLRSHEKRHAVHFENLRHLGAYWLVLALLPLELTWQARLWSPDSSLWWFVAWTLTMAGGITLTVFGSKRGIWPFSRLEGRYISVGAVLPFLVLLGLLPWSAFHLSGDGAGLPYLPVLNIFDLTQLAGMGAMLALVRVMNHHYQGTLRLVVVSMGFIWFSTLAARIANAWGGVPFDIDALMHSTLFQMLVTLFWTITSIGTMIQATRYRRRDVWFSGFILLGVVGGKLLLFDASGRGTLMWTGTLIGVAVLVLAASYFAPLPPQETADVTTPGLAR